MLRPMIVTVFIANSRSLPLSAQHEHHGAMPAGAIGSVSVRFDTSCAPAVQEDFN
jgi:hypothetical protein